MTTSMYSVTSKLARAEAAQIDAMFQPRIINGPTKYPIVACHGAGGDWFQWMSVAEDGTGYPKLHKLLVTAAKNGIPSVAPHMGGDTWGAPAGTTLVDAARVAIAAASGASSSKVHLVAGSMGAAVALEYAIANPSKVASITGVIPLCSLLNFYKTCLPTGLEANNAGTYWQAIATAWGVSKRVVTDVVTNGTNVITSATAAFTSGDVGKLVIARSTVGIPAGTTIQSVTNSTTAVMTSAASTSGSGKIVGFATPLPAGADLLAQAATLAGIPTRLYYAPDDALIVPADVTALAAAIGGSASATATDGGGHTNAGLLPAAFDYDEWAAWLISNGG